MKIAVILPPGFMFSLQKPNSIETVVRTLNKNNLDQDITIYCSQGAETHGEMSTVELAYDGSRSDYIRAACIALKQAQPDLIECHQNVIIAAAIAKQMHPIPVLVYRHNFTKKPKHIIDRFRIWLRHKPISGFVWVSEAVHNAMNSEFPDIKNKSFAIPNPIEALEWQGDPANKENLIIFSGRAAPEKGLEPLVDALSKVLTHHPEWKSVLILGDFNTHESWAQTQVDKLSSLDNQVTVLKSQPLGIVKEQISKAAIAIIPSVWKEPFGLVALEAHAAGCAVISSGTGGLREASGDNALYLSHVNAETIAEALEKLINDPELRIRLAQQGQAYVRTNHTVAIRQAQLQKIRDKVIGLKPQISTAVRPPIT